MAYVSGFDGRQEIMEEFVRDWLSEAILFTSRDRDLTIFFTVVKAAELIEEGWGTDRGLSLVLNFIET